MKKRLIVVLAVLATVVGMAFAEGKITYTYTDCPHKTFVKTSGNNGYQTLKGKCPKCQKDDEDKLKRERENVCNVLKGADYDAYVRTPECNQ